MTEGPRPDAPVAGEEPVGSFPADESAMGDETVADVAAAESTRIDELETQLAERTADLQRLQAEYLNYKRRVERDRDLVKQTATYTALAPITEVLDTIDRAREHGELDGGFKAVAEQLERVVTGVGLEKFGVPGDPFDPALHEALSHLGEDPDARVTTCKVVAKAGYKIGDRVVRAAQVLVVDPPAGAASPDPAQHASPEVAPEDPETVGQPAGQTDND